MGVPSDLSDFTESVNEMEEEFAVPLSPKLVIMFVIHMSVVLLLLYYFYSFLGEPLFCVSIILIYYFPNVVSVFRNVLFC